MCFLILSKGKQILFWVQIKFYKNSQLTQWQRCPRLSSYCCNRLDFTQRKTGIFWKSFDQNQTSCKSRHNKQHSGQSLAVRNRIYSWFYSFLHCGLSYLYLTVHIQSNIKSICQALVAISLFYSAGRVFRILCTIATSYMDALELHLYCRLYIISISCSLAEPPHTAPKQWSNVKI